MIPDSTREPGAVVQRRFEALNREGVLLSAVLVASAVVYCRCIRYGFVWDYEFSILANRYIGQWSFLSKAFVNDLWWFTNPLHLPQSGYYRPLENVYLGLCYHMFGPNPLGWHLTSIILSLVAVWLVFKIGSLLTGDSKVALLAALMFGLLPFHAEAVVWSVPTVLSAALQLAVFYFFIQSRRGAPLDQGLAYLCFGAALLTHESAVLMPVLIAVYIALLEPVVDSAVSTPARWRSVLSSIAPFAIEVLVYLSLRRRVLGSFLPQAEPSDPIARQLLLLRGWILAPFLPQAAHGHAPSVGSLSSLLGLIANYFMLFALPWRAGPMHQMELPTGLYDLRSWLPMALLAAAAPAFFLILKRHHCRRLYLFCILWMAIGLTPVLNLPADLSVRDRYLYLPSVGWCLMLASLAVDWARQAAWRQHLATVAVVALLSSYAMALWQVQRFWRDDLTLFSRFVAEQPQNAVFHKNLGIELMKQHQYRRAEREFLAGLRLAPENASVLIELSEAHWILGSRAESVQEDANALARIPDADRSAYIALAEHADAVGDIRRRDAALERVEKYPGGARDAALVRARLALAHEGPDQVGKIPAPVDRP